MNKQAARVGLKVVRSKGDYVVGRVGVIVELSDDMSRVRVSWENYNTTWVKLEVIEDAAIPYEIVTYTTRKQGLGEWQMPRYEVRVEYQNI